MSLLERLDKTIVLQFVPTDARPVLGLDQMAVLQQPDHDIRHARGLVNSLIGHSPGTELSDKRLLQPGPEPGNGNLVLTGYRRQRPAAERGEESVHVSEPVYVGRRYDIDTGRQRLPQLGADDLNLHRIHRVRQECGRLPPRARRPDG